MSFYGAALARVHEEIASDLVRAAAPELSRLLRAGPARRGGRVLDVGCGAGQLSERLAADGLPTWGLDLSPAMVARARRRVPGARFSVGSILDAALPAAAAAVAVGEVLNYLPDATALRRALRRMRDALEPGGELVFDLRVATETLGVSRRTVTARRPDFTLVAEITDDGRRRTITRDITIFLRRGDHYRRIDETHVQRVHAAADVCRWLRAAGLRVRVRRGYGAHRLSPLHRVFHARRA